MVKHEKRRIQMLQLLESEDALYLKDMAEKFEVSKETVRQDFDALSELETIERMHGGIKLIKRVVFNKHYIFEEQKLLHIESKKAIAYKALSWIDDGSTIFLDSGSTVACLFQYLNFKKKLIVVTSSIPLLMSYSEAHTKELFERCGHQFIFVGGHVNHGILGTHGPFFDLMMSSINIDNFFLSGDAFDVEKGLSNADDVPFSVVKTLIGRSCRNIVLIDYSKIGKYATFQCMRTQDIDVLITDYEFDHEETDFFQKIKTTLAQVKTK